MARGKPLDEETRSQVQAALRAGLSVSDASEQTGVPKQTVSRIRLEMVDGGELGQVGTEKSARIEGLVFGHLEKLFDTMNRQLDVAGSESYLREQPLSSITVSYEKLANTAFRILEAAGRGGDQPEQPAEPDASANAPDSAA